MGKGYLLVNVYADNIAQPVDRARVEIVGAGVNMELLTDSAGQTSAAELECPDKKYSLTPQKLVRPYSVYTVKVTKPGLRPVVIEGVEILDGETAIQNIYMESASESDPEPEYITIPDHVLWGDYPPKIVVDPETQLTPPIPGDILPVPLVPEYVIVHDGLPTNSAASNYYVLFTDYIKNVASSEIYSTWPYESIKANIYAILSFTMNRIYTEWYPSKGYPFTITSSTQFDQKYIHGRDIFLSISQVVDSVFQEFIKRINSPQPFFAQYNDGVKTKNPGWLSQWGSKDLADQGYTSVNILKYYYGNDIYLDKATIVEGVPLSFPGINLTLNICSDAVQKIQTELNIIAATYSNIPKIQPADGKYLESTKNAVEAFQRTFSMPVTGIIDFATWYRISYIFIGVTKMLQGRYEF